MDLQQPAITWRASFWTRTWNRIFDVLSCEKPRTGDWNWMERNLFLQLPKFRPHLLVLFTNWFVFAL